MLGKDKPPGGLNRGFKVVTEASFVVYRKKKYFILTRMARMLTRMTRMTRWLAYYTHSIKRDDQSLPQLLRLHPIHATPMGDTR